MITVLRFCPKALARPEVERSPPRAVANQKLVFEQEIFSDDGLDPDASKQPTQAANPCANSTSKSLIAPRRYAKLSTTEREPKNSFELENFEFAIHKKDLAEELRQAGYTVTGGH